MDKIITETEIVTLIIPIKKVISTRNHSKWITVLNIRPKTGKLLEENIGEKPYDINLDNDFIDRTPKAQATKQTSGTTSNGKVSAQQRKQLPR